METIENCLICNSKEFVIISKNTMFGMPSDVIRCINCNFVFLATQLNDQELIKFYKNSYRQNKNEYFDDNRSLMDLERAISQYKYVSNYTDAASPMLEIGGGWGVNAEYFFSKGYNNISIKEWDESALNNVKNPKISKITSQLHELALENYDFIFMSNVLEHLFDINNQLKNIYRIIRSKGYVFIEIPNGENNYIINSYNSSCHYWFFNKKNIIQLLEKFNLDIINCSCWGKDKYVEELSKYEYNSWVNKVINDEHTFVELPEKNEKAYYIRIIAKK
ncbi:MAG TPA: hypothetical protein DCS13_04975 [Candidatus Margulisbacteria bacterium]|nr:MAG: hypothetical protein A2X43_00200 [Candidatus Margulisbacteria bacterium GWD2_39_127]HAR62798.1 hypothetical protein [Candidatus Margulisiibacteriota bacterium]